MAPDIVDLLAKRTSLQACNPGIARRLNGAHVMVHDDCDTSRHGLPWTQRGMNDATDEMTRRTQGAAWTLATRELTARIYETIPQASTLQSRTHMCRLPVGVGIKTPETPLVEGFARGPGRLLRERSREAPGTRDTVLLHGSAGDRGGRFPPREGLSLPSAARRAHRE